MIVRNESAILRRCLLSVLPVISCYVVCDTGSSDDTVKIVQQTLASLPGEIHHFPFLDFAQARNQALELARASALEFDYVLFIDADMELVVTDGNFLETLSKPSYLLRQVAGNLAYSNVRLLARQTEARYIGVTHEYLQVSPPPTRLESAYMLDHACGSSRSEKTERDLRLLRAALELDPTSERSLFYLGQTLREAGRYAEAVEAYQRRIDLGGWDEEVWYSRFMVARCEEGRGEEGAFVTGCLEAYQLRPRRAEPLHALAQYYRKLGRNELAAAFCEMALKIPQPEDILFVDEEVYRTGLRHEMSISGYYCQDAQRRQRARRYAAELMLDSKAPSWVRDNVRSNWKHYARSLRELLGSALFVRIEHPMPEGYHPCNPTLAVRDGKLWCVLRTVNYELRGGHYVVNGSDGVVRTQNYLLRFDSDLAPVSSVPITETLARPAHPEIEGLEDIRLTCHGDSFRGSATVVGSAPDYRRRLAIFDLGEDGGAENLTLQEYDSDRDQKNWVPLVVDDALCFVYWSDPVTVLRWDEKSRQVTPWHESSPIWALENQRGSSGAIPFDGGWLYVTHEVTHHEDERTYLHRFVFLDEGFEVQAVSEAFYFQNVGIEFCCGLVQAPGHGHLLLSFGAHDRQAWLVRVEESAVRAALWRGETIAPL